MFHEPPPNFLYSSYLINVLFVDGYNKPHKFHGTGFIIAVDEKSPFLVTNRHIIDVDYRKKDDKFKGYKLEEITITGRKNDDTLYSIKLASTSKIFCSSTYENDIVLIQPRTTSEPGETEMKSLYWHYQLNQVATNEIIIDSLFPYDDIVLTGFHSKYDVHSTRPILRAGKIASDPKFDYSWSDKYEGNCIAYEGFSTQGASGSPIFAPARGLKRMENSRRGYIVGVNAGHLTETSENGIVKSHSGISYFYKSHIIWDILYENKLIPNKKV